jgi:hypothetical protein
MFEIYVSLSFSISPFLFKLPKTDSAKIYGEQINEWINIGAFSIARLKTGS